MTAPIFKHNLEVLLTRQRHEAERAGLHYDVRMVIGDKAYSWATKKEIPEPGQSIILWEQPVHDKAYALSDKVIIPPGNYGAGVTTLDFVRKATISNRENFHGKFKLTVNNGETFLFRKVPGYGENAWLFKNLTRPIEKPIVTENKYLNKIASDLEVAKADEKDELKDVNKYTEQIAKAKTPELKAAAKYALSQEKVHAGNFAKIVNSK